MKDNERERRKPESIANLRLLTPKEVAEILAVKPGTLYAWISKGVNIPHLKIQGVVRFEQPAVMDWLESKKTARKKRNFEL